MEHRSQEVALGLVASDMSHQAGVDELLQPVVDRVPVNRSTGLYSQLMKEQALGAQVAVPERAKRRGLAQ